MVEPRAVLDASVGAVVVGLEAAAALVILVAGVRALLGFLVRTLRPGTDHAAHRPLRHEFGRSLLLALDFTIGSDMLKVALAPTFEGVAIAGLVVTVRTVLTLVLEYELGKERRGAKADEDESTGEGRAAGRAGRRHLT
jgi:uncharacterized membrane protein